MDYQVVLLDEALSRSLECFWEEEEHLTIFCNNLIMSSADVSLHNSLEALWKQDHHGILPEKDLAMLSVG